VDIRPAQIASGLPVVFQLPSLGLAGHVGERIFAGRIGLKQFAHRRRAQRTDRDIGCPAFVLKALDVYQVIPRV
jgi:RsiW-degrading membrane proteinase PrsW (M82 family)